MISLPYHKKKLKKEKKNHIVLKVVIQISKSWILLEAGCSSSIRESQWQYKVFGGLSLTHSRISYVLPSSVVVA